MFSLYKLAASDILYGEYEKVNKTPRNHECICLGCALTGPFAKAEHDLSDREKRLLCDLFSIMQQDSP